jgi:peptidoglycan/xylan/chitin deacetylase (PgdA/CDA1 family)
LIGRRLPRARQAALRLMAATGLPRWLQRAFRAGDLAILTYHAVCRHLPAIDDWCFLSADAFRLQMEYLKRHVTVLPLEVAVARLRAGEVRGPTAAITFDDGFRNNHDVAFPILRALGLPATVFLNTGFTGTADTVWFCRLVHAFGATTASRLEWNGLNLSLESPGLREEASARVQTALKAFPQPRLREELARILRALGQASDQPFTPESPYRMLDGEAIAEMDGSGLVAFGAHTHTHAIVARLPRAEQEEEIGRSVQGVARLTGRPCRMFAYPNGGRDDYDPATLDILRSQGVELAVTMMPGANDRRTPLLELKRYGVASNMSMPVFQLRVHHVWRRPPAPRP